MTVFVGRCKGCAEDIRFECSREELAALPVDTDGDTIVGSCECGSPVRHIGQEACQVITYGEIKITKPGVNMARGKRSDAQQEAVYSKMIQAARKRAKATKEARKGTRRKDTELRHVGSIPRELYSAVVQSTGDRRVWDQGGDKILKRMGLHFDS